MPSLVPEEHFPNAVAWSSTIWQIATIAGPALGGFGYKLLGPSGVYATSAALSLVAMVTYLQLRPRAVLLERRAASWRTFLAGIDYVRKNRALLGSVSLNLFAVLLGGATALLPVFASDVLHVGPWGLGILRSAPAIGASIMAIALAHRPLRHDAGRIMLACVFLFGVATIVFGLSTSFALSLGALVVLGAADMVSVMVRSVIVQLRTPPEMRGRVSAVNGMFIVASNELGEFESGVTAAWLGTIGRGRPRRRRELRRRRPLRVALPRASRRRSARRLISAPSLRRGTRPPAQSPQHCFTFLPLPHVHGSLRPIFFGASRAISSGAGHLRGRDARPFAA